ncbi:hypothetical protein Tco_1072657 [Tanacetum coccineum]
MILATTPLSGFSGEISWPLGHISLMVSLGDEEHSANALMNFMVVRSPSPYNEGGIVTLHSNIITLAECRMVAKAPSESLSNKQTVAEAIKVAIHPEVLTHKAKKKRTGTRPEQIHPRRSYQAHRSSNHEGGALTQLALEPSPGKETRW